MDGMVCTSAGDLHDIFTDPVWFKVKLPNNRFCLFVCFCAPFWLRCQFSVFQFQVIDQLTYSCVQIQLCRRDE